MLLNRLSKACHVAFLAAAGIALAGQVAAVSVQSTSIQLIADSTGMTAGLYTVGAYAPPNASFTYPSSPSPASTSHLVLWVDGVPVGLSSMVTTVPMAAFGSGVGAYLQGVKTYGGLELTLRYEISPNPQSGLLDDTMKIKYSVRNTGATAVNVALRLEIDTDVNGVDGANISLDNGFSTIPNNLISRKSGGTIPNSWWVYDISPLMGTPNLVGRGSVYNNPYEEPATMPDAFEVADYGDTSGFMQWTPATPGNTIYDSTVVLWWTGGLNESSVNQPLAPGATMSVVTYYGINQGTLLTTPTPTRTVSATFTQSPTRSFSPTASPSFTITPSFSPSPTFSDSPTPTPSFTATQTYSHSPTLTPSPTVTPTSTPSFTRTATPTATPSATLTASATATPTFTASVTFSVSPTFSHSPTVTPTFTATPLTLKLHLLPPNPNPTTIDLIWLPFYISVDCDVDIQVYSVAGEKVRHLDPVWTLAGTSERMWDLKNDAGRAVATGTYIYRLTAVSKRDEREFDFSKCAVLR